MLFRSGGGNCRRAWRARCAASGPLGAPGNHSPQTNRAPPGGRWAQSKTRNRGSLGDNRGREEGGKEGRVGGRWEGDWAGEGGVRERREGLHHCG